MNKYAAQAAASRAARRRERMCGAKRRYETEQAAHQKGQRVYQCPHCRGWHRSGKLAELQAVVRRKKQ